MTILSSIFYGLGRSLLRTSILIVLPSFAVAQQPPVASAAPEPTATGTEQSLGAVARTSKAQGSSHARKVITEDDMDAIANALPHLRTEGAENSDEVIAAIGKYKETHTPAETEGAVQAWYERYDEDLAAAIQDNQTVQSLREENAATVMNFAVRVVTTKAARTAAAPSTSASAMISTPSATTWLWRYAFSTSS